MPLASGDPLVRYRLFSRALATHDQLDRTAAVAQPYLRVLLFLEAERPLHRAGEKRAEIYAPKTFSQGMEAYNEADDYFKRGKPLKANLPPTIAVLSAGFAGAHQAGPSGNNKRIDVVIMPAWAIVGKTEQELVVNNVPLSIRVSNVAFHLRF